MRRAFRWGQYMWECEAGQADRPVGCERHDEHHWCSTCRGWYDVPHVGIHDGPSRHPNGAWQDAHSACRPCMVYTGRDTAPTP